MWKYQAKSWSRQDGGPAVVVKQVKADAAAISALAAKIAAMAARSGLAVAS